MTVTKPATKNTELQSRFIALWIRIGAKTDPNRVYERLERAYSGKERFYHNLSHLTACFAEFDIVKGMLDRPNAVEFALWFHDAVYDPRAKDNEENSVKMAMFAAGDRFGVEYGSMVCNLIMDTKHVAMPPTRDGTYMVDIDLAILGQPDAVYDEYARCIRAEYAWVPEEKYREGRANVLEGFLKRASLYTTKFFNARYGKQAHLNLRREISSLRRRGGVT
jgi:predicted metal-dependent HD superfamily phosphohydrolase